MNALLSIYLIVTAVLLYIYSLAYVGISSLKYSYLEGVALIIAWPLTIVILFIKYIIKGIIKLIRS